MKTATVTFHRAINYGAVLQTFALHNFLKNRLGIDNEIIDYRCKYLEKEYGIISRYKYCGNYKGKILFTLNLPSFIAKKLKFRRFINKNISISKKIKKEQLSNNNISECYDIFITGSDQVWNVNNTGGEYFYFLNFVNNAEKKKSYAASFGYNEIPVNLQDDYKKMLSTFSDISVREYQGAEIIKNLLNIDIPVLIDPTFLLDKAAWAKLIKNRVKLKDYILVFGVCFSPNIHSFVRQLQERTGCPVVIINDNILENVKVINFLGIGLYEFIELFSKARYIVTNSFHGTAFSINFKKDFFVELQQAQSVNTNSRIESLLRIFNFQDRILTGNLTESCLVPVNYENVDSKLEEERKKAFDYLVRITTPK